MSGIYVYPCFFYFALLTSTVFTKLGNSIRERTKSIQLNSESRKSEIKGENSDLTKTER